MGGRKEIEMAGSDGPQLLFQTAFVLYTSATYLQTTMYTQYAILAKIFSCMRYLAFALLMVLIALTIWIDVKESGNLHGMSRIRYNRYGILCLLVGALTFTVSVKTGDRTTLYVAAFLFAGRRRYLNNTLRIAFITQIMLMIFVIISSIAGIIPDLLIKRDAIPIRHSLGFTYPNVCTAYFFFLLLLYLWLYGKKICVRDLLWMEIINCLIFLLTDARMTFLLGSILLIAAYIFCCRGADRICTRWIRERQENKSIPYRIFMVLYDYFAIILFLLYTLLCVLDQVSGGNSILDRILSGRLGLTVSAVKNYGIHLIADKIAWVGFGGTEDTDALLASYNFVDCSYAYVLLSYGILIFLILIIYLVSMQKYIREREGAWNCLLMIFALGFCLLEPRLLEIQVNCFLILGAPLLRMGRKREGMKRDG